MPQPLLQYDVAYPQHLSRLLIFVKWLLVIPHLVVLTFVWLAAVVVTFVAWFAILITGRYPRGMWEFVVKALRWTAYVTAYTDLQRDEYPPFGDGDYPCSITWTIRSGSRAASFSLSGCSHSRT